MQTVQRSASPSRRVRAFEAQEVYLDWEDVAVQMVAILRAAAIAGVRNDRLTALVGELSVASPEFARSWADYRLFEHTPRGQAVLPRGRRRDADQLRDLPAAW